MADFVAVIRRAVDGLATNTPEARVRVYDKARGAVQRQLENMKPRPPEEMLRRQMDKLEAAIAEVETEHAEALPADDVAPVAAVAPVAPFQPESPEDEPAAPQTPADEPVVPTTADEPVRVADEEPQSAPAVADRAEDDDVVQPHAGEEAARDEWQSEPVEEAPKPVEPYWPEQAEPTAEHQDDTAGRYGDWRDEVPREQDTVSPEADRPAESPVFAEEASPPAEHDDFYNRPAEEVYPSPEAERRDPSPFSEAETVEAWHPEDRYHRPDDTLEPATPAEQWTFSEPEPVEHRDTVEDESKAEQVAPVQAWDEVETPAHSFGSARSDAVEAHFGSEMRVSAAPVRMPQATDIPTQPASDPVPEPAARRADEAVEDDPFEAYVNAQPAAPAKAQTDRHDERDPWSDLEDLIGYTKEAPGSETGKPQTSTENEDDLSDLLSPAAKPYRVTPVRKRNYAGIILGIVALLLLGGGAYAVWLNRDSLNDMVGGLINSSTPEDAPTEETPPESSAVEPSEQTPPPSEPQATPEAGEGQAAPPPADGSSQAEKFTQRLMQDGTEVDEGPGDAGTLAQNAEGQSVAQLNAPPADPGPAAPAGEAAPAPGATAPATPSATPSEVPAAAGERMFLYEERIGQSSPTAIEGTASWSLQREPAANGGPPEPVIQGRITIPGRGLTALLSIKRNTDSSLPASHLIEIVFAVPPDFEGGAIDSVLRIAMKQTEQDRGNALVAVPAKITDDFHMIALNDFPDARATNLDLLRTRDWMDIPVAYRNGRRALLTLQKGADGRAAFDEAIREWSQNSGGQTGQ
jgi:hypothetical protein